MDNVGKTCEIIKQVIGEYAKLRPSHGDIRLDAVFDDTNRRYALMQVGWNRGRRVRGNLAYVTVHDDQVWIEYDGIEAGLYESLIDMGIPENQIVLAFLSESDLLSNV